MSPEWTKLPTGSLNQYQYESNPIPRIIRNGAVLLPDLDSRANGRNLVLTAADYPVPEPEPEPIRSNS